MYLLTFYPQVLRTLRLLRGDAFSVFQLYSTKYYYVMINLDVDESVLGLLLAMYVLDFSAEYFEAHLE